MRRRRLPDKRTQAVVRCWLTVRVDVMTSTAVKSLPVLDDGRVVGVVSRSGVVHLMARPDKSIRQDVLDLLSAARLDCEVMVDGGSVTLNCFRDPCSGGAAQAVAAGSVGGVVPARVTQ